MAQLCPDGVTSVPGGYGQPTADFKYFKSSSGSEKWPNAALSCQNEGATLAMFKTPDEYAKLMLAIRKYIDHANVASNIIVIVNC